MNSYAHSNTFHDYNYNSTVYIDRTHELLRYNAERNFYSLAELIDRLFEYHSRLLVVRIDLEYLPGVSETMPVEVVHWHRSQLLEDRRGHAEFDGLVGYAWGLEYGENGGGWHYHLLAIYNSAERRDGISLGLGIGELWQNITNGLGKVYISNFDEEKLERAGVLGIGRIHRDDRQKRICLVENVAAYIVKRSSLFEATSVETSSGRFRAFGRSKIPPPLNPDVPRRGRPPVRGRQQ
jgi:hypothetical protein